MASYDREWQPTRQFAEVEYASGTLLGEFPLWTGSGRIRRRVDGILVRNRRPFVARQWKELVDVGEADAWVQAMRGGNLVVIQTKLTTVSLAVLGQALASHLLIGEQFDPAALETVALTTGYDTEVSGVLSEPAFQGIRVAIAQGYPSKSPRLEPKRDPELRARYAQKHLDGWRVHDNFPLTALNRVECVYSKGSTMNSPADFEGEDVVLVHTASRPHLDLLGHAVFGAAIARQWRPRSLSSRMVVRADDAEVSGLLARFEDCELVIL
jgi:hypothetical protein